MSTADNITDFDFDEIASPEFAIDSQIEQRSITQTLVLIEKEPDGPDVAGFEGALWPRLMAGRTLDRAARLRRAWHSLAMLQ